MAGVVLLGTLDAKVAEHAFPCQRVPTEIPITESTRPLTRITPAAVSMS